MFKVNVCTRANEFSVDISHNKSSIKSMFKYDNGLGQSHPHHHAAVVAHPEIIHPPPPAHQLGLMICKGSDDVADGERL